jgi:K(+)-stimulated pyrophosphate-energized sodium pump
VKRRSNRRKWYMVFFAGMGLFFAGMYIHAGIAGPPAAVAAAKSTAGAPEKGFQFFQFMTDNVNYDTTEKTMLWVVLLMAVVALLYAWMLVGQVKKADTGTKKMQSIADAVRSGANAYLGQQFKKIVPLIVVITAILYLTKMGSGQAIAVGRAGAFLMGSLFSLCVGFVGMRLATQGNLRVAAAARKSYGTAMQLGYRTGTITGMLTDGLGLLGGTLIFMAYGEHAYEALLGFGFGGTLLALFMRVGGGIYTKAADVGADLVGKIEKDIPEDDPRNAATIADNVGDNVGDCAGMAADIFESYEVTIVAAMILGYASFGHKGVIFPLLVRAIGVFGSIVSTYSVRAGDKDTSDTALKSVHRGFMIGSIISVIGFFVLGFGYLKFDDDYMKKNQQALAGYTLTEEFTKAQKAFNEKTESEAGALAVFAELKSGTEKFNNSFQCAELKKEISNGLEGAEKSRFDGEKDADIQAAISAIKPAEKQKESSGKYVASVRTFVRKEMVREYPNKILGEQPAWTTFTVSGLDLRPALTCLIGIILAICLNKCTSYFTHTTHQPVKDLAKSCQTGHATNIIQGIALGYESTVAAILIIAAAIAGSVLIYTGASAIFVAYGVAMCGIGMLTLTGNTISMDVFGPVADNANGIGEMGYDKEEMEKEEPGSYKRSRQILADLDAVGNTTKAETKGIAIGSAVIAAVSLFTSFIAVIAVGSEDKISDMTQAQYAGEASNLSVAAPMVFIGLLIGGAVPFLFSSMLMRAVGRAAFLIVKECRMQFRDKEVWAGTKTPDYGRVVGICTTAAQKELIGPGMLGLVCPLLVGFVLGPYALGGFLAGMILVGQLLAVFMANAGGAWDNAKKSIEDGLYGGKGSEAHKAAVTGDTVGDPLKDTAGPAVNPLIKVMNMVSLLALPLVIYYNASTGTVKSVGWVVGAIAVLAIIWAVWQSKRETEEMKQMDEATKAA